MRKQRAFASLTEAEIQQIAEWLRHETYEVVLERLRKPRPEGFGLDISRNPLATLHAKTNRVDRINNRIASGQRLTLAEFDAINAGEKADVAEEIHDAIMDETHAMATSGENTPTQLLAFQRLADFPARAEYREHKRQLELRKCAQRTALCSFDILQFTPMNPASAAAAAQAALPRVRPLLSAVKVLTPWSLSSRLRECLEAFRPRSNLPFRRRWRNRRNTGGTGAQKQRGCEKFVNMS